MLQKLRALLIARVFPLLQKHARTLTVTEGPGILPLPWTGPNGEVWLVTIDAEGTMIKPPRMCRTPREMMQAMGMDFDEPTSESVAPITTTLHHRVPVDHAAPRPRYRRVR
jgi:hypothetical protein